MRKIFFNLLILTVASAILFSCKKDEVKTVMQSGVAPVLSASQPTLVLTAATQNDTVETFSWTPADYGFSAAVGYTLQIAKAGTSFANARELSLGNNKNYKYTVADLNQLALLLGLSHSSAGKLDVRVKATLSDSIPALLSNVSTITLTPYQVVINYPSLWVPGSYQGWDPASAPKISSRLGNGIYEGYANITGASPKFKYTSHPDWTHTAYGWASSTTTGTDVAGTFNTTGGDLFTPGPGYYLLTANTNTNEWTATKTTWAIIGDAPTLSNSWANDVPLVYDAANNVWKVTTTFAPGKFKFRANGAWALNFGDTGADLSLEYGGGDIIVTSGGTKTVTLDLKAGNYSYTIQ